MPALLNSPLQRVVGRFVPVPLPPTGTFAGQTALIVGATTGIGLAAATHFANLGANVIITTRVTSRGVTAKSHIEKAVGPSYKGEISILEVDLERYDSCTNFMKNLKNHLHDPAALDVAIVNGGIVNSHWEESAEGWEKTIQINTIGTTLIGLLLLGWMSGGRAQRSSPAHLIFLSSREHLYPNIDELIKWSQREDGVLRQVCSKDNWPGGFWDAEPNYAISKLLVMYTIEEITKLAEGPDCMPLVIVNSVCPGMVKTDIGRHIASRTWIHKILVYITLLTTAKSADSGARICVMAAEKPIETHGEFFNYWLTSDEYRRHAVDVIGSGKARTLQKQVWQEDKTITRQRNQSGQKAISMELGVTCSVGVIAESEQLQQHFQNSKGFPQIEDVEFRSLLDICCDPSYKPEGNQCRMIMGPKTPASLLNRSLNLPKSCSGLYSPASVSGQSRGSGESSDADAAQLFRQAESAVERAQVVVEALSKRLARTLSIKLEDVDTYQALHAYGLDSLIVVKLRNWLGKEFVADVPVFEIVSGKTVEAIGQLVAKTSRIEKKS